ncbi:MULTISPECIES: hypothetical protein [Streptomyces]|uniref:Uncharacterized protein n=4 Tax=Streptomyces TaxID=1883 RepID=A0AAP6EEX4_9ACTN|nr:MULTISPECIES: hypothetical protein [Streptomyces]MBZ3915778.1 hypothetical protein [Streptomyces acidiscabies]MDW8476569.1 hypothetical protein [Streptomyces scabiei]MDX2531786.1 hypothetical protein [Streptomyces scabiei]MDX2551547.1 hypothetical protein [Streptomyces stelliscabiei]MDX2566473.1 hypothetical protein [Streptomyces scabiei]
MALDRRHHPRDPQSQIRLSTAPPLNVEGAEQCTSIAEMMLATQEAQKAACAFADAEMVARLGL